MTEQPQERADLPIVSIVVPMYQEAAHIDDCLDGFAKQTYPKANLEVLVVDGGSTDGCRERVEERMQEHTWLRLLDNPKRVIPAACNVGLWAATGSIVCFFSSHGVPAHDFVERVVAVLEETGASGVGGTYRHEGGDPRSRAIGRAMASRYGMASTHRFAEERTFVDTISHPAYPTKIIKGLGGFDESLLRNEDYELNWRLRAGGHQLVFDPTIVSIYRPRGSLRAMGQQFWWYGWWKAEVCLRNPRSTMARHLVPPAFVAVLATLPLVSRTRSGRLFAAALLATYGLLVVRATTATAEDSVSPGVFAASLPTMHVGWGAGFLAGLVAAFRRRLRAGG